MEQTPRYEAPEWVQDAVFYQIFTDRFANGDRASDPPNAVDWSDAPTRTNFFGGDLQGIVDHLPYLQDLGISALYLTPIFKAMTNHKYDTADYLTIDPAFGDEDCLRRLVEEAHRSGIRVVLDGVFNHCGESFWAFQDVLAHGAASQYADWFIIDSYPVQTDPPSYQTCGGAWYLPKLNTRNPVVQEYLLKVIRYWIERCKIDGWRMDVPWKVPFDFWEKVRTTVKAVNPEAYIVGEVWRDARNWLTGSTFDAVMNYPLRDYTLDYCLRDAMDAEDFDHELTRLRQVHGSSSPFQLNLLGSHDTPRILTLAGNNIARSLLAVTFLFTYIGAPMIYYGDEIGLLGGNDPDCRAAMPWDEGRWNSRVQTTIRTLSRARRDHPALRRGTFETLKTFNGVYAYRRHNASDDVIVILNPRDHRSNFRIALPANVESGRWRDILSGSLFVIREQSVVIEELNAQSGYVLVQDK